MQPSIQLLDLGKRYGDFRAVDGLSLDVPSGRIFGLLGPNGAGKTTTIRMLMDIIAPDTGSVRFFGRERTRADLTRVGYLPEERGLYRKMTVTDQLVFLGELHGMSRKACLPEVARWLDRVELAHTAKQKVEELSKGMQQKIQLVGTLLHDPEIVVLDEPFSGLDPINQGLFKDVLAEYRSRDKTILFSTHVMEQAEKLCDAIALISRGKVVLAGALDEIKHHYGGLSYRVAARGDLGAVSEIEGLESHQLHDGFARLILHPEADPAAVLRALTERLDVTEFRSEAPELGEIFIAAVGAAEAAVAEEPENRESAA